MGNKQEKEAAPPRSQPNTAIASIGKMESTQNLLTKRRDLLDKRIKNFVKTAKTKMKAGDKKGALFALKQKKMYEKQVNNLENQLLAIEQQKVSLEGANISATVVNTMATGASAMKTIHSNMDIDSVEDLRDDIMEQMDMSEEINDAIGAPMGEAMDEDELMDDLNSLMADDTEDIFAEADANMAGVPSLPDASLTMPDVPVTKPTVAPAKSADDAELAELEMMM